MFTMRRELDGKQFQSNLSAQSQILREIDLAHAAGTQLTKNFVILDMWSGLESGLMTAKQLGSNVAGRHLNKAVRIFMKTEKGFDLKTQGAVANTRTGQKTSSLRWVLG